MHPISLKVVLTFIKKEFRQMSRTRAMMFLVFGAPLIQILVLGFAVTNEVKHVKLYLDDRDNTHTSMMLRQSFSSTDRFDLVENRQNRKTIDLISDWKAQVVITIPPGFSRELALNRKPALQIMVDGIDGNSAAIATSYAQGIIALFIQNELNVPEKYPPNAAAFSAIPVSNTGLLTGITDIYPPNSTALSAIPPQIEVQDRMWYNVDLNSPQYMIPGLVVILVTIISMMISAMSLVKEKEIGTLEQLMVTPVRKSELLLGKLIPYWLISLFEINFVMLAAHFIFHIHFAGNPFTLVFLAAIFLMTTLGLGILISTMTSTQQQAMFFAWFMMVFMLLLSGFFVPIANMPPSIKYLTLLNPMSYFMTITREIVIKGNELKFLWKETLALLSYGLIIFTISIAKFRKTTK